MKTLKFLSFIAIVTLCFTSCDEDDPCTESTFYQDADGDGLGNAASTLSACELPEGYVENTDDNDDTQALTNVINGTIEDLYAPQTGGQGQGEISGEFTRFDFETQSTTDSDSDWDIAFRGTTIIVNGGVSQGTTDEPERTGDASAYIVDDALFSEVTSVNTDLFAQDAAEILAIPSGSDNGWYNYNFMTNTITPLAGKVLVFRTTEGLFAKVEILSYYQGAPAVPDGFSDTPRYYTFNYTYQPNNNITSF